MDGREDRRPRSFSDLARRPPLTLNGHRDAAGDTRRTSMRRHPGKGNRGLGRGLEACLELPVGRCVPTDCAYRCIPLGPASEPVSHQYPLHPS